jgi:ABC-type phosphate/phosphonate transport system substrate-binding protein
MLFVPSVEQGTLVRRGDELARFIREDSGLMLRTEVPTSYAAVIQALGTGQADVAWLPAFAYVIAHARYDAEARLQVVRSVDLHAIVVTRSHPGEPATLAELARAPIAVPQDLPDPLRHATVERLDEAAPGWREVPASSDTEAVRALVADTPQVQAAVSSSVFSGPHDLTGDGRKKLEAERPGTLADTQVIDRLPEPVRVDATHYYGCILTRTGSGVRRVVDLSGKTFAFSDETSTSGHIFPRILLQREGVTLGHDYFAGGHANVVQAVWDGKVAGGSSFYSPPSAQQVRDGHLVGDARFLILKRLPDMAARRQFLEEVRILALTDPIPNDVCCVRQGFSGSVWERFERSLQRFLDTEAGQAAYFDLVAGVAAARCSDATFDGFRQALTDSGVSAAKILDAAEAKLQRTAGGDE